MKYQWKKLFHHHLFLICVIFPGMSEVNLILDAIRMFEAETCLRFEEISVDNNLYDQHLIFTKTRNLG